jgi:hypothetical protein
MCYLPIGYCHEQEWRGRQKVGQERRYAFVRTGHSLRLGMADAFFFFLPPADHMPASVGVWAGMLD